MRYTTTTTTKQQVFLFLSFAITQARGFRFRFDAPSFDSTSSTSRKWPVPSSMDDDLLPIVGQQSEAVESFASDKAPSSSGGSTLERLKAKWLAEHSSAAVKAEPIHDATCASAWAQCGGRYWRGSTCCSSSKIALECRVLNSYYSQCQPICPQEAPCSKKEECYAATTTDDDETKRCGRKTKCVNPDWCREYNESRECSCGPERPCLVRTLSRGDYCAAFNQEGKCDAFAEECTAGAYEQCGGIDHLGHEKCPKRYACVQKDRFYSQCLPV